MKEILDVVSPDDEVIGKADREECHREELRHRGIHIFVFNSKGEIFMQKRSNSKDIFPGYLECSLTGHVLSGENYLQAALREAKEELGIDVKEKEIEQLFKFKIRFKHEHEILTHFKLKYDGPIKLDKEEVASGKFVSVEEAKKQIKENEEKFHPATLIVFEKY